MLDFDVGKYMPQKSRKAGDWGKKGCNAVASGTAIYDGRPIFQLQTEILESNFAEGNDRDGEAWIEIWTEMLETLANASPGPDSRNEHIRMREYGRS